MSDITSAVLDRIRHASACVDQKLKVIYPPGTAYHLGYNVATIKHEASQLRACLEAFENLLDRVKITGLNPSNAAELALAKAKHDLKEAMDPVLKYRSLKEYEIGEALFLLKQKVLVVQEDINQMRDLFKDTDTVSVIWKPVPAA